METLSEKGVRVEVWFEGEKISPDKDGYLGSDLLFRKREKQISLFTLNCYVPKMERIYGMVVDGKKNVVLMKNRSRDSSVTLFSIKIPAKDTNYGVLATEYPQNNMRLLILKEGYFEIWELAIVSQDGLFFLTEQRTYESQCFLDENGEVVCPQLAKWPQLIQLLKSLVKEEKLLPSSKYVPLPTPKAEGLSFKQGRVVWWNYAQGLGAIVIDKKGTQARVHWSKIVLDQSGGLRALQPGQIVSYQKLVLPRQSKGRITGFLYEAVGVKAI